MIGAVTRLPEKYKIVVNITKIHVVVQSLSNFISLSQSSEFCDKYRKYRAEIATDSQSKWTYVVALKDMFRSRGKHTRFSIRMDSQVFNFSGEKNTMWV